MDEPYEQGHRTLVGVRPAGRGAGDLDLHPARSLAAVQKLPRLSFTTRREVTELAASALSCLDLSAVVADTGLAHQLALTGSRMHVRPWA